MRTALTGFVIAAATTLAGCADQGLRVIRPPGSGPDEFAISPVKPLTEPQDFSTLPAPTPGGRNLTDPTPQADAVEALGGRASALAGNGVPAGDAALVNAASRYGVPANTRAVLAKEDAEFRKRRGRFTNIRLFRVDRYEQAYARQDIDPWVVQDRFRKAGAETPTSPPDN